MKILGFPGIESGLGFLCFAYSPFLTYLRDPPARSEREKLDKKVDWFWKLYNLMFLVKIYISCSLDFFFVCGSGQQKLLSELFNVFLFVKL